MKHTLVMLQTNSNQPFIFSSPRLREQIGASFEITLLSHWVKKEAKEILDTDDLPTSFWVSNSSGKVIVRFTGHADEPKAKAKDLIRRVTLRALTEAPGLDVTGVFIEATSNTVDADDLQELDRVFLEYSLNRRPAAARFPQFPFLERGSESALPASASLDDLEFSQESLQPNNFDESSPLSLPSRVKRAFASMSRKQQVDDVKERLTKRGKELKQEPSLDPTKLAAAFQDGEEFEDAKGMLSSVGVVHIDGNGVGAIMRDLGSAHSKAQEAGVCVSADEVHTEPNDALQAFIMVVNKRLDKAVKDAIALSWYDVQELTPDTVVPIVPVLVGGDDVTVYTDGRFAIPFAEAYIRHYEELTEKDELLKQLAVVAGAKEAGPLTASAGVAIVGRNFPFHIAYDLAEELVSRGKKLGKKPGTVPCSTINFHVLRDATVLDPDDTLDEYKGRSQRPFLIGCYAPDRIGDATTTSKAPTAKPQPLSSWARILQAVAAFDGKKPDDPTQTTGDPFPRARANRIVKLLARYVTVPKEDTARSECLGYVLKDNEKTFATQEQIDSDKQKSDDDEQKSNDKERITKRCNHPICLIRLEWTDAQENARGTKTLVKALGPLPSQARLSNSDEITEDCIEQVRWLLDLIDLSGNLPDGYLASRISGDADCVGSQEAADTYIAGGAQ
ncbi:Cas10/Cmr2 second palm domain-containing protein [Actinomyces sp.]